jgi:hypothetical protein
VRRWTIINVLLGLVVALLGMQIVRTWARSLPLVEVSPRAPAAEAPPAPPREKGRRGGGEKGAARALQQPPALVAAIAEKELFDPSRKPPTEEAKVETPKTTGPPAGVTVVGVRIVGKDREVFMTETGGNAQQAQRRLHPGDEIAGYTIKVIEATGVTLASPSGDLVTMSLAIDKGKAAAAARPVPNTVNQPPVSTAAGVAGGSPAAGIARRPGAAAPVAGAPAPATPPARQRGAHAKTPQLPPEVERKLDQLKRPGK